MVIEECKIEKTTFENRGISVKCLKRGSLNRDLERKRLKGRKEYTVKTVSLNDLLERYKAPYDIDYLSIDTEGTELEILRTFDFNKYSFSVITVEHNFSSDRDGQYDLLSKNGYRRILENVSYVDDWYLRD